ncbi:hypothetical protein ANRL4_02678 [Anaerolineae bacterium]|nr:hypothetical protein ANRL4_02678 [Anaerolineae bacterium]
MCIVTNICYNGVFRNGAPTVYGRSKVKKNMTEKERPPAREGFKLNEDWLATIVGLILTLVIAIGGIASIPYPLFKLF